MAHKKAGGSTRNGRDSESKRLGVKVFGGEKSMRVALLFVSEALSFTQAKMLVWVKTIHFLQQQMVLLSLFKKALKIENMLRL